VSSAAASLLLTVPQQDHLGFWADQTLNARKVADFLHLDKRTIAKVAEVSTSSVRFDQNIPTVVAERLTEIANICEIVAQHVAGNPQKTALWFKTKDPLLGDVSPRDMIRFCRYDRLRRFVNEALEENAVPFNHRGATGRHRKPAPPPTSRPALRGGGDATLPWLIEVDRFSAGSLHRWPAAAKKLAS
jgi:hypothetical protein